MAEAVVIIGAGPAGLALGACLRRKRLIPVVLEAGDKAGFRWHHHYRRLHLHTDARHSALPHSPFPIGTPTYPSRQAVVDYLTAYQAQHRIEVQTETPVTSVVREGAHWSLNTPKGLLKAQRVVVATGYNQQPKRPKWAKPGTYRGHLLHSRDFRTGCDFKGQSVLVVGMGNTGAEIALDLWEQGAKPALSVRGPVRIMPRDALGEAAQVSALRLQHLPLRVQDALGRAVSRLAFGDLRPYGLHPPALGPASQVILHQKIPVLDIGTVDLIKAGHIPVYGEVAHLTEGGVAFKEGPERPFDAILLATGYRPAFEGFIPSAPELVDERGYPKRRAPQEAAPGLYFLGFNNPSTGFLRQINIDARATATAILRSLR